MNFRISSGLKDLIGNELITDNYIAVFELVKNSFDAGAKNVIIKFDNIYEENSRILIIDDGKGMDYVDLKEKWLFVAYSAKRDGTEDEEVTKEDDYRKKLNLRKFYAGAKGVGRFSCDRLGSKLNLITKKNIPASKIENLTIDWKDFEGDQKKEFIDIDVRHKTLESVAYDLRKGTVLEITELRNKEEWNQDAFRVLKEKLSKLIRPQINRTNTEGSFKIFLDVKDEKENDNVYVEECKKNNIEPEYRKIINGEISNFIFEHLDLKTTKILSSIDETGSIMTTTLVDRDKEIYSISEKNTYTTLKNIHTQLYFLNRAAKGTFTKKMGIEPVNYGNVFIYKNGFRVHPYGDPRNDFLGIDTRALQQYSRLLGTRNLIGQIDIAGENDGLKETTSRDGGLIRNQTFGELIKFFFEKTLKRLEKYVVVVTDWGVDDEDLKELGDKNVRNNLVKLIANISKDDSILSISYNEDIIRLIEDSEKGSAKAIIRNFKRIATETKDKKLLKDADSLEKKFNEYKELNKVNTQLDEELNKTKTDLLKKKEQLSIATSISSQDLELVTNLHHQVFVISDTIKSILKEFSLKINNAEKIGLNEMKELIDELTIENSKIESISKFGMRAIFEDFNSIMESDIIDFLANYVSKISNYFKTNKIRVEYKQHHSNIFNTKFRPLDISIIIDNMISNAKKNNATILTIETEITGKILKIYFKDNGTGIDKDIDDTSKIFEKGFSTTKSTGLGLYHVSNLIRDYKWKIDTNRKAAKGAEFIITIDK